MQTAAPFLAVLAAYLLGSLAFAVLVSRAMGLYDPRTFGSKNPGDLPVDAHELIALCAPRPTFISYGVPEKGDAKWLDQQGSYMAAVAAGTVFRLLGAKDLGTSDDYNKEKMPPVNTGLLEGQLAWRQHDGGHTDGPNWKYFIPWADKMLDHKAAR